ncbi:hypothetical protein [Paenibacillus rigui]|uniref:Uncharacterized protein n=1 Tax=Paenibacillus rigui TaxID=554312 RepID=A0A229UJF5_9BACL|nr:hypothetical protein [Paenibacillus rigui]OXM83491.1 hypothetical protein CF651_25565 [Paenibacillus rigui]
MNWHEAENKVKLHILHSLARSQRALARIIESMADAAQESSRPEHNRLRSGAERGSCEEASQQLLTQLTVISSYQKQLTGKLTGIRIRKFRRGEPGKVWLHEKLRRQ